jgi:hypothetical protein
MNQQAGSGGNLCEEAVFQVIPKENCQQGLFFLC